MKTFFRSPIVVGILMALLCIGAGAGIYFGLISPTQAAYEAQVARYTPVAQYTDPVQGPQLLKAAQQSLASAQQNVAMVQAQWSVIQVSKNPEIDFSDRYRAWLEYNAECQFDYAQRINAFLTHTGVKPLTLVQPLPTVSDPNQPAPTRTFVIPMGSISVFGSYNQITNHIEAWNRFSRIVRLDGLNITGYNPFLTATYTATEFIYTNNSDKPGPDLGVANVDEIKTNATFESVPEYHVNIPNATLPGAAGPAGGAPGGFGGPGGGFGGPGGGFGGPGGGFRGGPPAGFGGPPPGFRGGPPGGGYGFGR